MNPNNPGQTDQALNTTTEEALQNTQTLNQDFAIGVERRKAQLEIETEINKQLGLQFETSKKILDTHQEMVVQISAEATSLSKGKLSLEEQEQAIEKINLRYKEILENQNISSKLQKEIKEAIDLQDWAKVVLLSERARGEIEQTKDFTRDIESNVSKFAKSLGITANVAETGFGKMKEFFINLTTGNAEKKIEFLKNKFGDLLNPMNVAANLMGEIVKQAFKLESASISFSKATGFARDFDSQITHIARDITMAGGKMEDAASSLGDLAKGMSNFSTLSNKALEALGTLNFRLKQIGVSNAPAMFEIFSRNLRKGSDEAQRLTNDLILSGTAAGITAAEMSSNFESSFKELAVNGERTIQVFKDLAAQAKAAGVAISDLTSLGKDFDTFDKGAEKAAKLNAMLGTQISHMQMLNMSDEQRSMEMIRQIKMAVGNFDALSRSEKLYIAQSIAGGDVAKAQKLINMNMSEYLEKKDKMAAAAKNQEEMAKLTEQLVPAMDKLKMVFTQVALELAPVVIGIGRFLSFISPLVRWLSPLIVGLTAYYAITKLLNAVMAIKITFTKIKTALVPAEVAGNQAIAASEKTLAAETVITSRALQAMKANMIMSIGIIGALAAAIAYLIYIMVTPHSPPFYLIFGVIAAGVFLLNTAFNSAGPYGILFGAIIAGIVLGMSLMFYMIGGMIEKMIEFVAVMAQSPQALYLAAGGVLALAGAMQALALATILFRFDAFTNFANSVGNLGEGISKYVESLKKLRSIGGELVSALGDNSMFSTIEGGKTSVVVGKNAALASVFGSDKLIVDINMPDINFPTPIVHVYIDGRELSNAVREVILETR